MYKNTKNLLDKIVNRLKKLWYYLYKNLKMNYLI